MSVDTAAGVGLAALLLVCAVVVVHVRVRRGVPLGLGVGGGAVRELGAGLAIGSAAMTALAATLLVTGLADGGRVGFDPGRLGLGLVVLGGAAVVEEVVYRSVLLTGLSVLTRRPVLALVASAAVFGAVHLAGSPDATLVSGLSNAMGGLMYGVAFLRTGRIWMPVGIHFTWNFVQGTIFGFTVSGETAYSGAFLHPTVSGAGWLTGGAYGPEGSVLSLVARAAIIIMVLLATRRGRRLGKGREGPRPAMTPARGPLRAIVSRRPPSAG
ncbi:CPBP family intramembrane glutamic endopeptidase [Actinomadura sp. DC4]|uniref:CPBP family intramembrane glutamic endopeptidase n=1 Tax=Actinomadura sp. DC4 TaxID=3055069 RepID=UPI0025B1C292|nr:CPBP family intramembrane glutamic endopeptidase [Actinomadura sp. DC4]MDN3358564.1 CPBP family intramembrane metalloprotease [Actinomadura sp. DC4]